MLGRLAGGFHGFPFIGSHCDNSSCKARRGTSFRATYVFPAWLLRYSAHLTLETSSIKWLAFSIQPKRRIKGRSDNALFDAVFCGDVKLVKQILKDQPQLATDVTDEDGTTLAGWFCDNRRGNATEMWQVLVGSGVDPYAEDGFGFSPMDMIAKERVLYDETCINTFHNEVFALPRSHYEYELGWTYLHRLQVGWYQTNIVEVLKDADSYILNDINSQDKFGLTPLSLAALRGDSPATRALLEAGARTDIGVVGNEKKLPIFQSLWIRSSDVFWEFVNAGVDFRAEDSNGLSLLHHACLHKVSTKIIEFLVKNGVKANNSSASGVSPFIIALDDDLSDALQLFLDHGEDPNWTDKKGETALMRAIRYEADENVQLLLRYGADYTREDKWKQTILHYASKAENPEIFHVLIAHGLVGMDINAENEGGWSPLGLVPCAPNQREFVKLLCAVEAANARAAALREVKQANARRADHQKEKDDESLLWETESEGSSESREAGSKHSSSNGTDPIDGTVPHRSPNMTARKRVSKKRNGLTRSERKEQRFILGRSLYTCQVPHRTSTRRLAS